MQSAVVFTAAAIQGDKTDLVIKSPPTHRSGQYAFEPFTGKENHIIDINNAVTVQIGIFIVIGLAD